METLLLTVILDCIDQNHILHLKINLCFFSIFMIRIFIIRVALPPVWKNVQPKCDVLHG